MDKKQEYNYEKVSSDLRSSVETSFIDFSVRIEEMDSLLELQSSKEKREMRWKISGLVLAILAIVVAIVIGWESVITLLSSITKSLA